MARSFPRPLRRRDILYGKSTPAEELVDLGHAYLEQDLAFDAADFFAEAGDRDGLSRIKERAIRTGDAFLLRRVEDTMPDLVSEADWKDLAREAASLGKEVYAERAGSGGATPPPPLMEEVSVGAAGAEGGEEEGGADAEKPSSTRPRAGRTRRRKREIQGG